MRELKKKNERFCTYLIFALLPISGFAIDVYIPSFPAMAVDLHVPPSAIKLTLTAYTISYGLSQLLLGSIIDCYGRYKTNLIALSVFIVCSLGTMTAHSLALILSFRVLQGLSIGLVLMSRRAFFIDVYQGNERVKYMSLLSVVWSAAPIIAPFIGGYFQEYLGWRANFAFLAIYGFIILVLEIAYGGETLKERMDFNLKNIWTMYKTMFSAVDFTLGILFLGFCYGMIIAFGFSIPFIVEHGFHLSPLVTGYSALCSGAAILFGGMIARKFFSKSMVAKLIIGLISSLVIAGVMYLTAFNRNGIVEIIAFVVLIHLCQGFIYNIYFTYCVTRFPQFAGSCSGVLSGGTYLVVSLTSFIVPRIIEINNQRALSVSYLLFLLLMAVALWFIIMQLKRLKSKDEISGVQRLKQTVNVNGNEAEDLPEKV